MLLHIGIKNFALVEELALDLHAGLSTLTGETGSGKSILLSALGLVLGDRADSDKVRAGAEKTEIAACFDLQQLPHIRHWLMDAELLSEDDEPECIVRRSVSKEGRSRAMINGNPVTLTQLRELGEMLICIHSQHEHQTLLRSATHRELLDSFGKHSQQQQAVNHCFRSWQELQRELDQLKLSRDELNARTELLRYQVEELETLDLQAGELEELESSQLQLQHAETLQRTLGNVSELCGGENDSLTERLNSARTMIAQLPHKSEGVVEIESLLDNAAIYIQEAHSELDRQASTIVVDDGQLHFIEERLSSIYSVARKHRIKPEELLELQQRIVEEFKALSGNDEAIAALEKQVESVQADYLEAAQTLSNLRKKTAKKLIKAVNSQLKLLAMERAQFEVAINTAEQPSCDGIDRIEFLISTVPGQAPKALAKVASGGELSRVSLAIQVVTAQNQTLPTIVFDEVDVGVGGKTGDIVGQLLRELGNYTQVLCVTHLAQVASKANNHIQVEKAFSKSGADTSLRYLSGEEKIREIARMMGGASDSKQSLAHAKQMLEAAG